MKRAWAFFLVGVFSLSPRSVRALNVSSPLIQIGVEVVEVDEQKAQHLGIQWLGQMHVEEKSIPAFLDIGTFGREALFADLKLLEQSGAADLLANPKLVARDGTSATFHAGGEIPYATSGSQGSVSVEFKSYGVNLRVKPHLTSQDLIELSVEAEVSGPDTQSSVTLSGNAVPGIRSRRASSEITLAPGSTLTMAGLIQNDKEWTRHGVPVLMHIPLLKYLFSTRVRNHRRTSVVIFVTPVVLEAPRPPVARKITPLEDDLLKIEEAKDMGEFRG